MSLLRALMTETDSPSPKAEVGAIKFADPVKKVPTSEIKRIKKEKFEVYKDVEIVRKKAAELLDTPPSSSAINVESSEEFTVSIGGARISVNPAKALAELSRPGSGFEVAAAVEKQGEEAPLRKRAGEEVSSEAKKGKKRKVVAKKPVASSEITTQPGRTGDEVRAAANLREEEEKKKKKEVEKLRAAKQRKEKENKEREAKKLAEERQILADREAESQRLRDQEEKKLAEERQLLADKETESQRLREQEEKKLAEERQLLADKETESQRLREQEEAEERQRALAAKEATEKEAEMAEELRRTEKSLEDRRPLSDSGAAELPSEKEEAALPKGKEKVPAVERKVNRKTAEDRVLALEAIGMGKVKRPRLSQLASAFKPPPISKRPETVMIESGGALISHEELNRKRKRGEFLRRKRLKEEDLERFRSSDRLNLTSTSAVKDPEGDRAGREFPLDSLCKPVISLNKHVFVFA